jgi:hypothetical protein
MTISVGNAPQVQSSGTSGTSITLGDPTTGGGGAANDTVGFGMVFWAPSNSAPTGIANSNSNWIEIMRYVPLDNVNMQFILYYCLRTGSSPGATTISWTQNIYKGSMTAGFNGLNRAAPLVATPTAQTFASGTSASVVNPTMTKTQNWILHVISKYRASSGNAAITLDAALGNTNTNANSGVGLGVGTLAPNLQGLAPSNTVDTVAANSVFSALVMQLNARVNQAGLFGAPLF